MDITEFQQGLFLKGAKMGFSDMEIYYSQSKSTSVNVQARAIKNYVISEEGGLSFRGIYNGNIGYSFTETFTPASLDFLLKEAKENANILEAAETEELFAGAKYYTALQPISEKVQGIEEDELISAAFALEDAALDAHPLIKQVIQCKTVKAEGETLIVNSKGLNCRSAYAYISAGVYLMAKEGAETTTGGEFDFTVQDFSEMKLSDIARKAANKAVEQLGAASVPSGNYPVILYYEAAATLLGYFVSTLSGETVAKGFSRLEGKIGEKVAANSITLVEDPLMPGTLGTAAFDAEGYPTRKISLIDKGILKTFMHNLKTAKKAGVLSTGNAVKNSYAGTVTVGPHNVYVEPGQHSLDEMIGSMSEGILLTELQGMHAGINTVSGEFSLAARGFLIENGKLGRPVKEITAAGNLYELLGQVEDIASDLTCKSSVSSPSLKIKSLTISGE